MILAEKNSSKIKKQIENTLELNKTIDNSPKPFDFIQFESVLDNEVKSLKQFDFIQFEKILKKLKGKELIDNESFNNYKKHIINCVLNGDCEPIKMTVNGLGEYKIIDGKVRLLAHKLLGVMPIIETI